VKAKDSGQDGKSQGPDLVIVVVRTRPYLHRAGICRITVCHVRAEALIFERNAVVICVVPLLGRVIIGAWLYLKLRAIFRIRITVKTKVGTRNLHLGTGSINIPTLGLGAIALIYLHKASVGEDRTLCLETLLFVEIEVNGLSLIEELASGAESYIVVSVWIRTPIVGRVDPGSGCRNRNCRRRLWKGVRTTTAIAFNGFTKSIGRPTTGCYLHTRIGMIGVRNYIIKVVVKASANAPHSIRTPIISIGVEKAWISSELFCDARVCRDGAVLPGTPDVQVDRRWTSVVDSVLAHSLRRQRSGQDKDRGYSNRKECRDHVDLGTEKVKEVDQGGKSQTENIAFYAGRMKQDLQYAALTDA